MEILMNLRRRRYTFLERRKLRHQILELSKTDQVKLNIGSGGLCFDNWLNLDLPFFDLTRADLWEYYFSDAPVNNILMEHVLEHLTVEDVKTSLTLAKKYLHKNGMVRIAVPDKNHPNPAYIEYVRPGGSGSGADDHKSFWNYFDFAALLQSLGFSYSLQEYYDEKGNLVLGELNHERGIIGRTARNKEDGQTDDYSSLIIDFWL
jgi:predicted SAM-dependent methyltransferase